MDGKQNEDFLFIFGSVPMMNLNLVILFVRLIL